MDNQRELFEKELEQFLKSNGNLAVAVQEFYGKYPDREFRRSMVFFVLDRLISQAEQKTIVCMTEGECAEFEAAAMALMNVLKQTLKGGSEEENKLFRFSKLVRRIPGAWEGKEKLSPWAKNLVSNGVGMTIQIGREREYSTALY